MIVIFIFISYYVYSQACLLLMFKVVRANIESYQNIFSFHSSMKGSVFLYTPFFRFLELFCFVVVLPESISAVLAFSKDLLDVEVLGFGLFAMLSVKSVRDDCLFVGSTLFDLETLVSSVERCACYNKIQHYIFKA